MKLHYVFIILLLAACSLNADQEASLNQAVALYINSLNDGNATVVVGHTHPNAVAYYKAQGDSVFMAHYDLTNADYDPFYQDGTIMEVKSDGQRLHVKYNFLRIDFFDFKEEDSEAIIFAVSEDDGKSWFFIDEFDYYNDEIIAKKDRLIE